MMKIESQEFFIPGPLPGMNEMIAAAKGMKGRGIMYMRMKRQWTHSIAAIIKQAKIVPVHGPVHFRFVWAEMNKRRDPDNFCVGKKFIFDALVETKILKGDGWKYIASLHEGWVVDKTKPGVEVVFWLA